MTDLAKRNFYVLVSIDVPGNFTTGEEEQERRIAAKLVTSLLRDALFVRDIDVAVTGAIALTPDDVERVTLALHHEVERGDDQIRSLDAKMRELRAAVDRVVRRKGDAP